MFHSGKTSQEGAGDHHNELTSGRPVLHAEGQFVECHFSTSQFVPFRKVGKKQLKEILREAVANDSPKHSCKQKRFKIENDSRRDEFELTYLREASSENTTNKNEFQKQQHRQQQQQFFIQLLRWITLEGDEFVHIETFSDLEDVFLLLDIIAKLRNPLLTTVLISEPDPHLITVSTSSVHVDVECLLFCMFPT
ncbi:unnamed protein product [Porites lobata]|uniref:Uncharacterized protein n=1 Tax=Porites lobata TaxID=104759 RepID=A0ABN8PYT6_9CNID|nr:unnamed protein product [Porites lobata]